MSLPLPTTLFRYEKWLVAALLVVVLSGCAKTVPRDEFAECTELPAVESGENAFRSEIRYAEGFQIEYFPTYKIVSVLTPWIGADASIRYVLVSCGGTEPQTLPGEIVVRLPLTSLVTTSTTQLPAVHLLQADTLLVGHAGLDFVRSGDLKAMLRQQHVQDIGFSGGLNHETLLQINPDVIFTFAMGSSQDAHVKLQELNLIAVINGEYTEKTPLGRAEWIKFLAAFLGKERMADDIFNEIEGRYVAAKEEVADGAMPTAFSGSEFQGTWYIAGSDSYMGRFLQDAGARYVFDQTQGTLSLDFETVISKAASAEYWIGTVPFISRKGALASDERYGALVSVRPGHYAWYDGSLFEGAVLEPDVVLRDLIKIFHFESSDSDSTHYFSLMTSD